MRSQKVADIMWNHIEPVKQGTTVATAVRHLLVNHVTGLPVVDGARNVIGFVSEQDCIHSLLVSNYHAEGDPLVEDVMHREPLVVTPDMAVVDLAQNLGHGKPKVYPVVEQGRLVGIVTRTAILAQLAKVNAGVKIPGLAEAD